MARPKSDIAPRILAAARERFLREGVDGASLRAIAKDASTSIGMIYYYFSTKDELFLAVVEEVYATLLADLAAALDRDVPVEERVRRMYLRFARMSDAEATTVRMIAREALLGSPRLGRLVERFVRGHVPLVLGALIEGMAEGTLSSRHPPVAMLIATMALGVMPPVARRTIGERFPPGIVLPEGEELGLAFARILLEGIGAQGAALSANGTTSPSGMQTR